jgi:hypothetical protein
MILGFAVAGDCGGFCGESESEPIGDGSTRAMSHSCEIMDLRSENSANSYDQLTHERGAREVELRTLHALSQALGVISYTCLLQIPSRNDEKPVVPVAGFTFRWTGFVDTSRHLGTNTVFDE